jgi:hypothetical protein
MMKTNWIRWTALAALLPFAAACGDDSTGVSGDGARVSFSVAVPSGTPLTSRMAGDALFAMVPVTDGTRTVDIQSVELVLREIELERQDSDDCADHLEGEEDSCEEFEMQPSLLDLPLDGSGIAQAFEITGVPAGFYDEVEFEVHTPESDPGDDAFLLANPDFAGISIRVTGTYDDGLGGGAQPFTFTSNLSQEQEYALVPPIEVGSAMTANVTLQVDVTSWFVDQGGTVIDPSTASTGGPNESVVEENIQNSLHLYEDDDRDGDDDHAGDA